MPSIVRHSRLLVLDADPVFVAGLRRRAPAAGWELHAVAEQPPLSELLSLKLRSALIDPAASGVEFWDYLHRVRAAMPALGLLVCAEPAPLADRVRGLRLGADDWIAKPVHPDEALARAAAVSRRPHRGLPGLAQPLRFGRLQIDPHRFQAFHAGEPIHLTAREYEVLHLLASENGAVLEREQIYRRIWGYELAPGDRSVDVFILKLRTKLHEAGVPPCIHTHFHIGYRFSLESESSIQGSFPATGAGAAKP